MKIGINWRKLFPSMTFVPQILAHDYRIDLNAGLNYTTPKFGIDHWPSHSNTDNFAQIGYLSPVNPMMNDFVWAQMYGKDPYGPIMNPLPPSINSNITIPRLVKAGEGTNTAQ